MVKSNFHTHTFFCDGKDSAEDMVKSAISLGFTSLGFSAHSYFPQDDDWTIKGDYTEYINEILRLKEKYANDIEIFLGIEQELYSPTPEYKFEYVIGSAHCVYKNGEFAILDLNKDDLLDSIDKHYGGDFDALAEDYFALMGEIVEKTGADIIGHFDLISKFSEVCGFGESARYLEAAEGAIKKLVKHGVPFEINTGAMARGYRSAPYPSRAILEILHRYGAKIVISSDCHKKEAMNFGFAEAEALAKECGFTEHGIVTKNGIKYIPFQ